MARQLSCPQCDSERLYKAGFRYPKGRDKVQRWLCRSCGFRFSQPNVKINVTVQSVKSPESRSNLSNGNITGREFTTEKGLDSLSFQTCEDVGSHNVSVVAKPINTFRVYNRDCKCATLKKRGEKLERNKTKTNCCGRNSEINTAKGQRQNYRVCLVAAQSRL